MADGMRQQRRTGRRNTVLFVSGKLRHTMLELLLLIAIQLSPIIDHRVPIYVSIFVSVCMQTSARLDNLLHSTA